MARGYDLDTRPANRQRRGQLVQTEDWIRDFIIRAPLGFFATKWAEQPFVHPMTYFYDAERHCIYMHGSTVGRREANTARHAEICFCAAEMGLLLPSNQALHFSSQYRSVMAFGTVRTVIDEDEKKQSLYGLIDKYFDPMQLDKDYSPIREEDLKRTKVYAIDIKSWSGKENWKEKTDMDDRGWPELDEKWFEPEAFPMSFATMKK